ncbi:hypothetical protein MMC34_003856 [Xylographa carneopallida]|nr:hypothetical protein [Xylographa carneopallida]
MSYSIVAGVCQHHIRFDDHLPFSESGTNHDFSILYCPECSGTQDLTPAHITDTEYSIVAGICQHHIRFATQLPYAPSNTNYDFSTPYCQACLEDSLAIPNHTAAMDNYLRHDDLDLDDPDRHDARRRLDLARIDRAHHEYNCEDRNRGLLASRPAHLQPIPLTREQRDFLHGPSARIDTSTQHVDEEYYRDSGEYRRCTSEYLPGRYADTSGQGYLNTSDPAAGRRRARRWRRAAAEARKRDATPHPERFAMYDEDEEDEREEEMAAGEEEKEEEREERMRRLKDKLFEYRHVKGEGRWEGLGDGVGEIRLITEEE